MDPWQRIMLLPCGERRDCLAPDTGSRQICRPLGDQCWQCTIAHNIVRDAITGQINGPLCTVRLVRPEPEPEQPETLKFGQAIQKRRR